MGPININTDGIWTMARIGIVTSIVMAVVTFVGVAYVLARGFMAIFL